MKIVLLFKGDELRREINYNNLRFLKHFMDLRNTFFVSYNWVIKGNFFASLGNITKS